MTCSSAIHYVRQAISVVVTTAPWLVLAATQAACAPRFGATRSDATEAAATGAAHPIAVDDVVARARRGVVTLIGAMPDTGPPRLDRGVEERLHRMRAGPLGSGVLVADRLVLTTNHVLEGAIALRVRLADGSVVDAERCETEGDIAVVALAPTSLGKGVEPLTLGRSETLRLGETVIVIGDAFGGMATVSVGTVAGDGVPGYFVIDVPLHYGNTGGMVVSARGDLVGIADALASEHVFPGLALAIDSASVRRALSRASQLAPDDPREHAPPSKLTGLRVAPLSAELRARLGLYEGGVEVIGVRRQSRFDRAGLVPGDVVLMIDTVVIGTEEEMRTVVDATPLSPTNLLVLRGEHAIVLVIP